MATLQSTNVLGALCVNGVAVGGGKDFKYCCISSSTSFTPSQDLVDGDAALDLTMVGGGGGGGGVYSRNAMCRNNGNYWVMQAGNGLGGQAYTGLADITSTGACTITVGSGGERGYMACDLGVTDGIICGPDGRGGDEGGTSCFGTKKAFGGSGGDSYFFARYCCATAGTTICSHIEPGGGIVNPSTTLNNASQTNAFPTDTNQYSSSPLGDAPATRTTKCFYCSSYPDWENCAGTQINKLMLLSGSNDSPVKLTTCAEGINLGTGCNVGMSIGANQLGGPGVRNTRLTSSQNVYDAGYEFWMDHAGNCLDPIGGVARAATNGDPGVLTSVNSDSCITNQTASNHPEAAYGAGGFGATAQAQVFGGGMFVMHHIDMAGGNGNDGIVVLKWSE